MAKQRRPPPKSTKAQAAPSSARPRDLVAHPAMQPQPPANRSPGDARRIDLRMRGGRAVRARTRSAAAARLQQAQRPLRVGAAAVSREKELHERVRLYLNICQRHATPREARRRPSTNASTPSTLAINGGQYDRRSSHLRLVRDEDPGQRPRALHARGGARAARRARRSRRAPRARHRAEPRKPRASPDRSRSRAAARRRAFRAALDTPSLPRADRRRRSPASARPIDRAR